MTRGLGIVGAAFVVACALDRQDWSVVRSPTNFWKFIINLPGAMVLAAVTAVVGGDAAWQVAQAQAVTSIIAQDIPGASAISQVGTFLDNPVPPACANPIPTKFPTFIVPGAVLDPNRILVGSAGRTSAPRSRLTSGRRARSCRSTRAGLLLLLVSSSRHSKSRQISHRAADRPQPSAAPCRCSARTAPTGSTPFTILVRIPLTTLG
jgi:hypothetical protein